MKSTKHTRVVQHTAIALAITCGLTLGLADQAYATPDTAADENGTHTATLDGDTVTAPGPTEQTGPTADSLGIEKPNTADADPVKVTDDPKNETTGTGPVQKNFLGAMLYSITHPNAAPSGANDWTCTPTAQHPRPVVLLHGIWENAYDNWAAISPALKAEGYCVFAPNIGDNDASLLGNIPALRGTGPIAESAKEIAVYVDAVLAETGSEKVDIVAHSQGGLSARQYLHFEGGANLVDPSRNKVDKLVDLSSSNHGTTLLGIGSLGRALNNAGLDILGLVGAVAGQAASDQVVGSPLIANLALGDDTDPGIDYTVLATRYDEVITPYQSTFLEAGPGATVANITLQDGCDIDLSDHLSITVSPRAIGIVKNALDPAGFPAKNIPCAWNAPFTGQ